MKDNTLYELSSFVNRLSKEQLQKLKEIVLQYNITSMDKSTNVMIKK